MRDHDFDYDPPESTPALVVGTAFLAAWTFAVALYLPEEQARADRRFATRSDAEHTRVCVSLGFELRSSAFARCIDELIKLQVRHEQLSADHVAATSLL
jgi:hypothetical protein